MYYICIVNCVQFLNKYVTADPYVIEQWWWPISSNIHLSLFLCHSWVLFVQFLMKLHLRYVYMKRLYKGKIKQYINYGSSGESSQCFRLWFIFKTELALTSPCSSASMFVFLVWAVYAKVDIFRDFKYIYASYYCFADALCFFDVK